MRSENALIASVCVRTPSVLFMLHPSLGVAIQSMSVRPRWSNLGSGRSELRRRKVDTILHRCRFTIRASLSVTVVFVNGSRQGTRSPLRPQPYEQSPMTEDPPTGQGNPRQTDRDRSVRRGRPVRRGRLPPGQTGAAPPPPTPQRGRRRHLLRCRLCDPCYDACRPATSQWSTPPLRPEPWGVHRFGDPGRS